jgi:polar amino acid transport system permease protein
MAGFLEEASRFFGYYNVVFLGQAFLYTATLSLAGCLSGFIAGFGIAIVRSARIVRFAPARWLATGYVELMRRVPFLVKLMVVFFALQISGADVSTFTVAAITVALSSSAFSAENIRAGLESVHPNQWDAAEAMNMGGLAALWRVILPQAWAVIIPPSMTYSVGLVKSTSIASQIGVFELTYAAKIMNQKGFSATLSFGTILLLYFALCYPLNLLAARLETRLAPSRHR